MARYVTEFTKQPSERQPRSHTWEHNLPTGTSIDSVLAKCFRLDTGVDASASMIDDELDSGVYQLFTVLGGTLGDYKLTLKMTRNDGAIFEDELLMHVIET